MSKIKLVIPAFNEETNIEPFFLRCREVEHASSHEFSYIFVDDGSKDGTYDRIRFLASSETDSVIKGVSFSRNFGKESAMLAGLTEADKMDGDYTAIIDADLQQDPEYVVAMADYLDENKDYDCVCCYQAGRKEGAFMKFAKRRFYRMINSASDTEFVENASDFRMFRNDVVKAVLALGEYNRFSKGIFSWVGFKTHYMPYDVKERASGTSKWSFGKLMKYGVGGILGFSTAPLGMAIWLGMLTSLGALIFLIINVVEKLIGKTTVPGFATIVCLILFIGGVNMILLGIMGEYIAKMYMEVKNRPIFIVKDVIDSERNVLVNSKESVEN